MTKRISNVDKILPYISVIDGKLLFKGRPRTIHKNLNHLSFWIDGKRMSCNVNGLLIKYYNLKPPDDYHYYDLVRKCHTNMSLSNLSWKRRLLKDYNYTPEVFYKKGKVSSKVCGNCGKNLPISSFKIMIEKHTKNGTLRNNCESCRYKTQVDRIKKDPVKFSKYRADIDKWSKTEAGKKYHQKYSKTWIEFEKKTLSKFYIGEVIRVPEKYLTDELYQVAKKRYLLRKSIS